MENVVVQPAKSKDVMLQIDGIPGEVVVKLSNVDFEMILV